MANIEQILEDINPELLSISEGRVELCRMDPLLFALIYLPHHLMDSLGNITLSEFHIDLAEYGKSWVVPVDKPNHARDAFIAPRGCGKSTWLFTILPLWGAAYGYVKFVAAFSDAANQAETHLMTFKSELQNNDLLMEDFPELCMPKKDAGGRAVAQNAWRILQSNGFVFDANGIDTNSLGKKVGVLRPDLIILDDIEKGEKNYSEYQAGQQKNTVFDDIAPMNNYARMVFVGTTTMPNSVMDQFRKFVDGYEDDKELQWIKDNNVTVHYYPAIMTNADGTERSVWPEKWSLEWLTSQRHKRDFAKNYMNRPVNADGQFWMEEDIFLEEAVEYGNTMISIDPAVTKNKVSDFTGIAVLSRGTNEKGEERIYVREAMQVKLSPTELADKVTVLCDKYDAGVILVETNQGGDLWKDVFRNVPAKYRTKHQKVSKSIRAGKALNYYQKDLVRHVKFFPSLEEQMFAFPKVSHDDVLDAVVSGVLYFLDNKAVRVTATQLTYI